jgi:hypothetical protein
MTTEKTSDYKTSNNRRSNDNSNHRSFDSRFALAQMTLLRRGLKLRFADGEGVEAVGYG